MSDNQQAQEPTKRLKRPVPPAIGSLAEQLTSFGGKHPDAQTSESVDTSVAEHPGIQNSRLSNVQQSASPDTQVAKSPDFRKSKHPEWEQQTIYLAPALKDWLRVHAAQSKLEISEIVAMALKDYQERHP